MKERKRLGELLLEAGAITRSQLDKALEEQKKTGERLGVVLAKQGILTEKEIASVIAKQLNIPFVSIRKEKIDPKVLSLVPESFARRHVLIPIEIKNNKLFVAMSDPLNVVAKDELSLLTGYDIEVAVASGSEIKQLIEELYGMKGKVDALIREKIETKEEPSTDITVTEDELAPIIQVVNGIISQALLERASDIHIEPQEDNIVIRFRIDGVLRKVMVLHKGIHPLITTRIKVMAGMNIAEKRLPQDGRVLISNNGRDIDLRVSSLPTIFGEKIVMRILNRDDVLIGLEKLGFWEDALEKVKSLLSKPYGMILVTGPTGSGKTTTLYSMLKELNTVEKNIITVEEPVEYQLEGINQVQVNEKIGLTFSNILRHVLRQDPDVIMIGEIRDKETAEIAIRSALTGHLVLSTLHTNDAPSSITRLVDMGIEPYLVASSLIGVIAQRLVRKICPSCKEIHAVGEKNIIIAEKFESLVSYYLGKGCEECGNTGYKGRTGIFEIMLVSEETQRLTIERAPASKIRIQAIKEGMITIREDGIRKVKAGITTPEEVLRVTS
ncbi:MAG: GspE/PulE family protein [Synergistetes bacterium]|nr:GspE/PulE family protein [Synergistota bacterium]MCX8128248.1 GspE/PulE family protein [Synergistota bacterium]MDW8192695.1 GspE/PulE family protein [Synergistota bacterium]